MRVITVPADQMTPAEFLALHMPRKSKLTVLCEQLWDAAGRGDRAECARIRDEIKALNIQSPYDLEAKQIGPDRFEVAA